MVMMVSLIECDVVLNEFVFFRDCIFCCFLGGWGFFLLYFFFLFFSFFFLDVIFGLPGCLRCFSPPGWQSAQGRERSLVQILLNLQEMKLLT